MDCEGIVIRDWSPLHQTSSLLSGVVWVKKKLKKRKDEAHTYLQKRDWGVFTFSRFRCACEARMKTPAIKIELSINWRGRWFANVVLWSIFFPGLNNCQIYTQAIRRNLNVEQRDLFFKGRVDIYCNYMINGIHCLHRPLWLSFQHPLVTAALHEPQLCL